MVRFGVIDVVTWPGVVLHELTHALVGYPVAERTRVMVWGVHPMVELEWNESTPDMLIRGVHLAPTIIGSILTVLIAVLAGSVLSMGYVSNPFHALAIGLIGAGNWLVYVYPSYSDRNPFSGGDE